MTDQSKLFTVGKIVNTHGVRGEIKVLPHTDFPEERFAKGSELILVHPERDERTTVRVQSARPQKNVFIVKLEGFDDINQVETYKGHFLKVDEEQQGELEEGEYYYHEIIGCRVVTDEGAELGTISEILAPGANHVWVVERPKGQGKPVLLPVIDDVILDVNVADKTVRVHILEGLLD